MSIVKSNLLSDRHYTPYCGYLYCLTMPRTIFNGSQFECPCCKWKSSFDDKFISEYKDFTAQ